MIRLLLWLLWLGCVIQLYQWLANNWNTVTAAPGAYILFSLLMYIAASGVKHWEFNGRLKKMREQRATLKEEIINLKEQLLTKDERLKFKDEQIQELKKYKDCVDSQIKARRDFQQKKQ